MVKVEHTVDGEETQGDGTKYQVKGRRKKSYKLKKTKNTVTKSITYSFNHSIKKNNSFTQ